MSNRERIYLDHNATTPLADEVLKSIPSVLSEWGNPSSIHWLGRGPKQILRQSRSNLAEALGVHSLELIFTSGASESNSSVIRNTVENQITSGRNEIIVSAVEHPSLKKATDWAEKQGMIVHRVPISLDGQWDWDFYNKVLSEKTALVSVMVANNETGFIFPVKEIAYKAHTVGALVHTDATQAFGKIALNFYDLDVDFASLSGHKIYALKGVGLLFVKKGVEFSPLIFGGGQERSRRGGTENILGIYSFGLMAAKTKQFVSGGEQIERLRDSMEKRIVENITDVTINKSQQRLPNTSSLIIDGVDGETLLMNLDIEGFAVSTGAACSSGNPEPSPVLIAIGLTRKQAQNSLRLSLGVGTTAEQIDYFIEKLIGIVNRIRSLDAEENYKGEIEIR